MCWEMTCFSKLRLNHLSALKAIKMYISILTINDNVKGVTVTMDLQRIITRICSSLLTLRCLKEEFQLIVQLSGL